MSSIRTSLYLICVFYITGCGIQPAGKELPQLLKKLTLDAKKNIVVNVLNPGDCQTCVAVGKMYYDSLLLNDYLPKSNIVFVVPEIRKIEQENLFKQRFPFPVDIGGYNVISDNGLVEELKKLRQEKTRFSFVIVYDEKRNVVFKKQLKDKDFMKDIQQYINPSI
jgi:hypothetical protein